MSTGTEFITIIRPSFMRFCKDACRSAAFNHILFRIAGKCKDQPKNKIQSGEITWYAKTEQIQEEMSNAWGVCKIRQEVNGLIEMGIVGRSNNKSWGADRTKHFAFGTEQCQKLLDLCDENNICVVHLGLPVEVMHLIYSSNANDRSIKCSCQIEANMPEQMMNSSDHLIYSSNANDEFIEAITIDDYKDNYKDKESRVSESVVTANADANDTPTLSEKNQEASAAQEPKKSRTPRKPRVKTYPIPENIKDRVEKVYSFLNKWRQDITNDPDEKFERDYGSDEAVCSLFQGKPPTENKLRQLCEKMWNEPANSRTGYHERDHMTIKRICNRYKSESLAMAVKDKPTTTTTSYSVGGYTYNPEQGDVPELTFVGPFRNRKKQRGA